MKKVLLIAALAAMCAAPLSDSEAAKKKTSSRADYTKEQQAKFFKEALTACRKRFAYTAKVKVDYKRMRYTCYYWH
jgi:hypothetical protein